jgi:hypothetical protein
LAIAQTGVDYEELPLTVADLAGFHTYAVARDATTSALYSYDGQLLATLLPNVPTADLRPLVRADDNLMITLDWVRVRPFVQSPPQVTLGAPIGYEGTAPSTWRGLRMIAFRADAFDRNYYDEALDSQTWNAGSRRVRNSVTTAVGGHERDHVIIESARISGEPNPDARRSGVLRVDGRTMMETSHKIDADGSSFGYHHTAGFAGVLRSRTSFTVENGYRSPDGITVEIADSVIIVLRYQTQP